MCTVQIERWLDHHFTAENTQAPGLYNDLTKVTKLGSAMASTGISAYDTGLCILAHNPSLLICLVYVTSVPQRNTGQRWRGPLISHEHSNLKGWLRLLEMSADQIRQGVRKGKR